MGLSEPWDNTGLLLGDPLGPVERVMTCLTLTSESVSEAVAGGVQLVVAHHPLPFKPIAKITTLTETGRLLWELARAGISVYAPHTAWDSARRGINARLAEIMGLSRCQPLVPSGLPELTELGAGRVGELSSVTSLAELSIRLGQLIPGCRPRGVDCGRPISRIAIACGSGGSLLETATGKCDLFVTGEGTFHTCLAAQAAGISLLMIGHFASERFAMVQLAEELAEAIPTLSVWSSKSERDPVRNFG